MKIEQQIIPITLGNVNYKILLSMPTKASHWYQISLIRNKKTLFVSIFPGADKDNIKMSLFKGVMEYAGHEIEHEINKITLKIK